MSLSSKKKETALTLPVSIYHNLSIQFRFCICANSRRSPLERCRMHSSSLMELEIARIEPVKFEISISPVVKNLFFAAKSRQIIKFL